MTGSSSALCVCGTNWSGRRWLGGVCIGIVLYPQGEPLPRRRWELLWMRTRTRKRWQEHTGWYMQMGVGMWTCIRQISSAVDRALRVRLFLMSGWSSLGWSSPSTSYHIRTTFNPFHQTYSSTKSAISPWSDYNGVSEYHLGLWAVEG